MKTVKCKKCGTELLKSEFRCYECGTINHIPWYKFVSIGLVLLIAWYFVATLISKEPKHSEAYEKQLAKSKEQRCEIGEPVKGIFFVIADEVNFRTGPGTSFNLVVNKKASALLDQTDYRQLYDTQEITAMCKSGDWLQGKITKSSGARVSWETGWVHTDFISRQPTKDVRLGLYWDIAAEQSFTADEKAFLRKGALKVLKDEEDCDYITTGYHSSSKEGSYYVTCHDSGGQAPFNIWFTQEKIRSGESLALPEPIPENVAKNICHNAIKASTRHPSTLDMHILSYSNTASRKGTRTVIQEFSSKNSFGLELEYIATCTVEPDGELKFEVTETQ